MRTLPNSSPGRQAGAALIIALILLMVMSLLGLSSMRTTSTQEKMSANAYERSIAFQSAENALRLGEVAAKNWGAGTPATAILSAPTSNGTCTQTACTTGGLCQIPDPDCATPRWEESTTPWVTTTSMGGLSGAPEYFVEAISTTAPCDPSDPDSVLNICKRFRITARSNEDGRASVILQSIYATE